MLTGQGEIIKNINVGSNFPSICSISVSFFYSRIDHWDHEKERLIILTSTHLMLIKYNFVAQRIDECQRIQLHMIDRIQGGPFQYPDRSMTA